jgi:hypothetical protein
MRLRRGVRCLVTPTPASPFSLGLRRPTIVLSHAFIEDTSAERLRHVLAHELVHIRRHDYGRNLAQKFVRALLLVNPLAHWLDARIDEAREIACDREVLEMAEVDRRAYATTLLDMGVGLQAAWAAGTPIPFLRRDSNLQRRVYQMKIASTRDATIKAVLLASVVALIFGFIACSEAEEPTGPAVTSDAEAGSFHADGNDAVFIGEGEDGHLTKIHLKEIQELHPELEDGENNKFRYEFQFDDGALELHNEKQLQALLENHRSADFGEGKMKLEFTGQLHEVIKQDPQLLEGIHEVLDIDEDAPHGEKESDSQ